MKRVLILAVLCSTFLTAAAALHQGHSHRPVQRMLSMHTMYGVDGALVGPANPIRGIAGDELPWEVGQSTHGDLDSNGRLRVHVHGLVFADDPSVPPELRGTNDEEFFRAVVSCLTVDGTGALVETNLTTEGFPASTSGDAEIDAMVELPSPCIAPIVFVIAGSEDKWFAVTGAETEED
jgi:hypothetical protein